MIPSRVQLCALTLLCLVAPGTAHGEPCRNESFEGASYIVCSFDLTKDDLRIYWRGDDGKPYRTFAALAADLEGKGKSLRLAMNGGMYQGDFRPVGLYIENGREMTPANTATVTGAPSQVPNFYKKPNGVFYIGDRNAGILETERFLAHRLKANFATQSGRQLVRRWRLEQHLVWPPCRKLVKVIFDNRQGDHGLSFAKSPWRASRP